MDTKESSDVMGVAGEKPIGPQALAAGPGTVRRGIVSFSIDRRVLGEFQRITRRNVRSRVVENVLCAYLKIRPPELQAVEPT